MNRSRTSGRFMPDRAQDRCVASSNVDSNRWNSSREQLTSVCGGHGRREDHLPVHRSVTECVFSASGQTPRAVSGGFWAPLLSRCLPRVCLVLRQLFNNKQNSPIRTGPEKKYHMAGCSRATVAQALPNPAQSVLLNAATWDVYSQPSRSALHVTARVPLS